VCVITLHTLLAVTYTDYVVQVGLMNKSLYTNVQVTLRITFWFTAK